jgi:multidrug efflux system outer membrane protein
MLWELDLFGRVRRNVEAARADVGVATGTPNLPALNSIGTPEKPLRRRPDIRIAERRLAGATARVGVAVGDLFPKLTLAGSFGYVAPTFGDLAHAEARFFSIGPGITWSPFDLGRVRADQLGAGRDPALTAELLRSQSRTDEATSLIAVYKALGAGWNLPDAE